MKLRIALLAAASLLAMVTGASAGPVSTSATASATIVAPTTVTATRNLAFGSIAKPTTGTSTVTVASNASATATPALTGGGNAFVPVAGQAFAATFHLVGAAAETYTVTSSTLTFTGQAGNLANVGPETPIASIGTLGTLPGGGADDLYIGGHFDITSSTSVQAYSGALALTITFN